MVEDLSASSAGDRRNRLVLLSGVIASMFARFLVTRRAVGPQVVADESAYLAMARYLAGVGEVWNIGPASAYSPGYSILIAPLFRIVSDPILLFRSIVVVNIVLGGLLVLLYEAVARRLTSLPRPVTVLAATAAATLPALVVTANHAWSDNLVPVVFAGLMLIGLRVIDRPTTAGLTAMALTVGGAHLAHTRLLVLAVPVGVLMVTLAWQQRIRWRTAIGTGMLMGLSIVLAARFTAFAQRPIYPAGWSGSKSVRADLLDRVLTGGPVVLSTAGQLWYLLVTTIGLAGLGTLVLLRSAIRTVRSRGDRSPDPADPPEGARLRFADLGLTENAGKLLFVGASMLASLGVSVAFMTNRERSDQLVYGRYNESFLGILVVLGVASLLASSSTVRRRLGDIALIAFTIVVCGGLIWWKRLDLLQTRGATSTVLGLSALSIDPVQSPRRVSLVAIIALVILSVVSLRSHRRAMILSLVLAVLVPLGIDRASGPLALRGSQTATEFTSARDLFEPGDVLWFAMADGGNSSQFYRIPFYIDQITVDRRIEGDPWADGPELMIGSKGTPKAPSAGYRRIWEHPDTDLAIWVAPGPRQERYARQGELLDDPSPEPTPAMP